MDVKQLQDQLNKAGASPVLKVDGAAGKNTMAAVDKILAGVAYSNWSDARRRLAAEQVIYNLMTVDGKPADLAGEVDGLEGEQTRYARSVWIARQSTGGAPAPAVEAWRDKADASPPAGHNVPPVVLPGATTKIARSHWPLQNASAMDAFFGGKGLNQVTFDLPFPMRIAWEPEKTIHRHDVNAKVLDSEKRIWQRVLDFYGYEQIKTLRLDMYGGMLNVRKMRGGSAWSIHSWGCARDVDPDRNQLTFHRESATLDDAVYKKYWEFVYDEGALGLGPERNYDWMHYQYARLS